MKIAKKQGKFIVIEGIDSCGKGVQFKYLSERISKLGIKVLTADFPRYYTSEWGKMVGQFLTGKFGKFENISPYLAVLPYMIDEYTWARDIGIPFLRKGGLILLDRYFTSNVHQIAKLKSNARKIYRDWLWKMGYDELGILKPDMVLFLNVSPDITKKLIINKKKRIYLKGKKKDAAEKNWSHQWSAYREYLFITKAEKNWVSIKCITKGKIDKPEVIHERIWEKVSKII